MKRACHVLGLAVAGTVLLGAGFAAAQDWPQWRGPHRDGKATGFEAPSNWPRELTQKWKVTVGDGAATPALVGDKLYVFARQGGDEVLRCLDAETGKEVWQAKYPAQGSTDPAGFAGPRSSPAVGEGKVVTLGARGLLSCFDAATGEKLWSKDDLGAWPSFFVASSPLIVDGLCIAQLGGDNGAVVAYDLASGEQKWKEEGLPMAYASPVLMTVGDTRLLVGLVSDGLVAIDVAGGKKVWEKFFERGGPRNKAVTPIVEGDTLIYFNGTAEALQLSKDGDKLVDKLLWSDADNALDYNTPVLKDGLLIGLTGAQGARAHQFFCFHIGDGKTAWSSAAPRAGGSPGGPAGGRGPAAGRGPAGGRGGFGGGRGGGGMRADAGYGSIVDAGSVLIALTPSSDLIVFEPSAQEFKQVASYKVADGATYAYPVVSGNRIYIKDRDSVLLWSIE
jgi:outer membrane protein assembly factor BamB